MSIIDVNWPSTIGKKWMFLWRQLSASNWCELLASNWCHPLTSTKFSSSQIVFQPTLFCQWSFCQWSFSRHILAIRLTSCVDVHILFAIWHQKDVKIRSWCVIILTYLRRQFEVRVQTGMWLWKKVMGPVEGRTLTGIASNAIGQKCMCANAFTCIFHFVCISSKYTFIGIILLRDVAIPN